MKKTPKLDLPLEYSLIEFNGTTLTGKVVPELLDLADRGIVRYLDIVFIQKEKDGSVRTLELNSLDDKTYKMFVPIGEHLSSLFTQQDLEIAAGKLRKNTSALLLLWENLWAANFRKAIIDSKGKLVERAQIAPEVVKQFQQEIAAENRKKPAAKKPATKKPAATKVAAKKK